MRSTDNLDRIYRGGSYRAIRLLCTSDMDYDPPKRQFPNLSFRAHITGRRPR